MLNFIRTLHNESPASLGEKAIGPIGMACVPEAEVDVVLARGHAERDGLGIKVKQVDCT